MVKLSLVGLRPGHAAVDEEVDGWVEDDEQVVDVACKTIDWLKNDFKKLD